LNDKIGLNQVNIYQVNIYVKYTH